MLRLFSSKNASDDDSVLEMTRSRTENRDQRRRVGLCCHEEDDEDKVRKGIRRADGPPPLLGTLSYRLISSSGLSLLSLDHSSTGLDRSHNGLSPPSSSIVYSLVSGAICWKFTRFSRCSGGSWKRQGLPLTLVPLLPRLADSEERKTLLSRHGSSER